MEIAHPPDSGLLSLLILNSIVDSSTTAPPILILSPGRRWARCQLHAGIGYIPVASILMKSLPTPGGGSAEGSAGMLAIPGLDSRSLHNRLPNFGSVTRTSMGSTPATCRYEVRLWRISIHGVRHPSESGLLSLIILNSMPDSSTTSQPILDLSPGRHWAQRQLHAGILYVSGT